jgi:hypothetical protein
VDAKSKLLIIRNWVNVDHADLKADETEGGGSALTLSQIRTATLKLLWPAEVSGQIKSLFRPELSEHIRDDRGVSHFVEWIEVESSIAVLLWRARAPRWGKKAECEQHKSQCSYFGMCLQTPPLNKLQPLTLLVTLPLAPAHSLCFNASTSLAEPRTKAKLSVCCSVIANRTWYLLGFHIFHHLRLTTTPFLNHSFKAVPPSATCPSTTASTSTISQSYLVNSLTLIITRSLTAAPGAQHQGEAVPVLPRAHRPLPQHP